MTLTCIPKLDKNPTS